MALQVRRDLGMMHGTNYPQRVETDAHEARRCTHENRRPHGSILRYAL